MQSRDPEAGGGDDAVSVAAPRLQLVRAFEIEKSISSNGEVE